MNVDNTEKTPTLHRLLITAPQGGGGKTLVTLGIASCIRRRGFLVKPFKKGPDYIDAAWLQKAAQTKATNLDPFFLTKDELKSFFLASLFPYLAANTKTFALVEGNRGLFDGLDATGSCSTAELARTCAIPVVIVLNCTKMTRTAAALLEGLVHFDKNITFAGCILNNVGTQRQAQLLRSVIQDNCSIPLLGIIPRLKNNPFPERHMGLASFGQNLRSNACACIEELGNIIENSVAIDTLIDKAKTKFDTIESEKLQTLLCKTNHKNKCSLITLEEKAPKIAYVCDSAFWFYYEENLAKLKEAGAILQPVSLTDKDSTIDWETISGLYIGGGFPEDYAQILSQSPHLKSIRKKADEGLPIYAECGGFMLLAKNLCVDAGIYPMAHVFDVSVTFFKKPQGLGYVEGDVTRNTPFFPKNTHIRGHEFHYSKITSDHSENLFALSLTRGNGMYTKNEKNFDALTYKNVWASYTHIFAIATPLWAPNFISLAKEYAAKKQNPQY